MITHFKREWVTLPSIARWGRVGMEPVEVPTPEGDGWRLHSVVVAAGDADHCDVLYYTWERQLVKEDDGAWVGAEPPGSSW